MACTLSIPFWPTSTDCLSWSADNHMAVLGGEYIAILTPRLVEPGPNGRLWDTTLIKVNGFTARELPLRDPLPTAQFSIGEELSLRQALEAKWSPPGLAPHKACALTVLNANHVLCIWAPDGRPDVAENWGRQVIINQAIQEYYSMAATEANIDEDEVHARVQQRIRAFAWAPLDMEGHVAQQDDARYLAVATEGEDILFLRITSPHSGPESKWSVLVVGTLRLHAHIGIPPGSMGQPVIVDYACWDRWEQDKSGKRTIRFAYTCHGRLYTTCLKLQSKAEPSRPYPIIQVGSSALHLQDREDVAGPIRFVPGSQAPSMIAFGEDTVFHVDVTKTLTNYRTHHLDTRWDDISGIAFTSSKDGSVFLHITSLLFMSKICTTTLRLPLHADELSARPSWQDAIAESKAAWGTDLDLGSQVQERTAGIASSPLGDYIATCTSMHPSDAIAYVIGSDQCSTLNITWESEPADGHFLPAPFGSSPSQVLSAEALLFSLARQLERNAETELPAKVDRDSIVAEVLRWNQYVENTEPAERAASSEPGRPLYYLKEQLYAHPTMRTSQASRIVDIALKSNNQRAEISRPVVQHLVQKVLALPTDVVTIDAFSRSIQATYTIVSIKLNPRESSKVNGPASESPQACRICQQPIQFESLNWARCSGGHHFSRCALSLLPIQEPGSTKHCGICALQYLNEKVFPDINPANEEIEMADIRNPEDNQDSPAGGTWVEVSRRQNASSQPTMRTLAQLLFAACDHCVYCGGQFV